MCEIILALAAVSFVSAQNYHNAEFGGPFSHPTSFADYFGGYRKFRENFGLERRDIQYKNDNWNTNRYRSYEQYPYRVEYNTRYNSDFNGFNPGLQINGNIGNNGYNVQRGRSHNFNSEKIDDQNLNSRNTENDYHSNVENKFNSYNFNLNSRIGTDGENYNHHRTEFRSAVEKRRSERHNEFFNEENTRYKTYVRHESGDDRKFDSENIDTLAKISNNNSENERIETGTNETSVQNEKHDHKKEIYNNNNTDINNTTKVINEEAPVTTGDSITQRPNLNIETPRNTSSSKNETTRKEKTDDVWVWGVEDKVNVTTTTAAETPVTPDDLDDRAAFDGGRCATGKIKVGNECVDVD